MIKASKFYAILVSAFVGFANSESLVVVPLNIQLESKVNAKTVNTLFVESVSGYYLGYQIDYLTDSISCGEMSCAIKAVGQKPYSKIIFGNLLPLGNKLIFSATVVDSTNGKSFTQRITVESIEDMEAATKRIAKALFYEKDIESIADPENVTERESKKAPDRRKTIYRLGFITGFSFPYNSSFSKRTEYVGTFLNQWEFRSSYFAELEFKGGLSGTGINSYVGKKFIIDEVAPYFAFGFGAHLYQSIGPSFTPEIGIVLFNTYAINMILRVQLVNAKTEHWNNSVNSDVGILFSF